MFESVLNQRLESDECVMDLRFQLEWIQPGIASVQINNDKIVLVAIDGHNWRRPHICIQILKRMIRGNCV